MGLGKRVGRQGIRDLLRSPRGFCRGILQPHAGQCLPLGGRRICPERTKSQHLENPAGGQGEEKENKYAVPPATTFIGVGLDPIDLQLKRSVFLVIDHDHVAADLVLFQG